MSDSLNGSFTNNVDNRGTTPGGSREGIIHFEIPKGAQVAWVRVGLGDTTSSISASKLVYGFFDSPQ